MGIGRPKTLKRAPKCTKPQDKRSLQSASLPVVPFGILCVEAFRVNNPVNAV